MKDYFAAALCFFATAAVVGVEAAEPEYLTYLHVLDAGNPAPSPPAELVAPVPNQDTDMLAYRRYMHIIDAGNPSPDPLPVAENPFVSGNAPTLDYQRYLHRMDPGYPLDEGRALPPKR